MKRPIWLALLPIAVVLAGCGGPTAPTPSTTFRNTTPIAIPAAGATSGAADPYPSSIVVDGLPAVLSTVTVRLVDLSHAWPNDLDVLLVGPGGEHSFLLSDAGGTTDAVGVDLSFAAAAADTVPDEGPLTSGAYRPSAYGDGDFLEAPAPEGPYVADLSVFAGTDPNGTWSLYVDDDAVGDVGSIAGGWSLTFPTD